MSYATSKNKKRHYHQPRSEKAEIGFKTLMKSAVMGALISIIFTILLSLLASGLSLLYRDPASIAFPLGIVSLYVAAFIGGVVSAKGVSRDRSLATGATVLCGFALFIFWGIASVSASALGFGIVKNLPLSLLLRALCIACSVLGAYICRNRNRVKRRR